MTKVFDDAGATVYLTKGLAQSSGLKVLQGDATALPFPAP